MKELFDIMPQTGRVEWIGLRPEKKANLIEVENANVKLSKGLDGDHYKGSSGKREVTLIQKEHLDTVASILKKDKIEPFKTRRNIVVSGINLQALKDKQFSIGEEVVLETTGMCHPCSRMEQNLGAGGYNAMRGHGGITTRVIKEGLIKKGDSVKLVSIAI
jgi:MOSC domain-containing protein YiiM